MSEQLKPYSYLCPFTQKACFREECMWYIWSDGMCAIRVIAAIQGGKK